VRCKEGLEGADPAGGGNNRASDRAPLRIGPAGGAGGDGAAGEDAADRLLLAAVQDRRPSARIHYQKTKITLDGAPFTNGRPDANGHVDGNAIETKKGYDWRGCTLQVAFSVLGPGKYTSLRIGLQGLPTVSMTTHHSWADSQVIPNDALLFLTYEITKTGKWEAIVCEDWEDGEVVAQANGTLNKEQLERAADTGVTISFGDNYAGTACRLVVLNVSAEPPPGETIARITQTVHFRVINGTKREAWAFVDASRLWTKLDGPGGAVDLKMPPPHEPQTLEIAWKKGGPAVKTLRFTAQTPQLLYFVLRKGEAAFFAANNTAVPGRSMGKVMLMDSVNRVFSEWGEPDLAYRDGEGMVLNYSFGGLIVSLDKPLGKVVQFGTNRGYFEVERDGRRAGVGDSPADMIDVLGKPALWDRSVPEGQTMGWPGLAVMLDLKTNSKVTVLYVMPRGKERDFVAKTDAKMRAYFAKRAAGGKTAADPPNEAQSRPKPAGAPEAASSTETAPAESEAEPGGSGSGVTILD
jgi:hypothetical protein